MPFKDKDGNALPACDTDLVYREWKNEPSVRLVTVKRDRMFEPTNSDKDPLPDIKINIRDCVHNQYVLKPLLHRMAKYSHHPLPYIKPLAREILV